MNRASSVLCQHGAPPYGRTFETGLNRLGVINFKIVLVLSYCIREFLHRGMCHERRSEARTGLQSQSVNSRPKFPLIYLRVALFRADRILPFDLRKIAEWRK